MKRHASKVPSKRQLRVGEELRHALSRILMRGELHDPALQDVSITVTEVRPSPDLKNATAFVLPLAGEEAEGVVAGLRRAAPYLRTRLAREVELRNVPALAFEVDRSFERAERTDEILRQVGVEPSEEPPPDADEDEDEDED